jgi:hypothetical protein
MANSLSWSSIERDSASATSITTPVEATDPADACAISVMVFWFEDAPVPTITDTASNTYSAVGSLITSNGKRAQAFLCEDANTSADFQVTATWGAAQTERAIAVSAVAGAALTSALGITGGSGQTPGVVGAGSTTTGTLSSPSEDGHFVHTASASSGWPDNYDVDSPYTELGRDAGPGYVIHGYRIQTTAAAATATFTQDATATTITLATTIKAAGGGGGSTQPPRTYYSNRRRRL